MTKEAITHSSESIQSTPSNPASADKPRERLPFFIFLATLLGSLIGVAADLSDASGLIVPIRQHVG